MAITILQTPAEVSLAQSPIIFSVSSSLDIANSGFQYVCDLYYWTGSIAVSGSPDYQLVKYPNAEYCGIFDLSRIINSTMTSLAEQNPSNVVAYKADFYYRYLVNNQYVNDTGSLISSDVYKALDGYSIFQEPISQQIYSKTPYWPLMTDGPATQSCFTTNTGRQGAYVGVNGLTANNIFYESNLGLTNVFTLGGNTGTTQTEIRDYPIGPLEDDFPFSTIGLEWFKITAYNGATPVSFPIKYNIECTQKYPNVRIKWKNRFGQFDYYNFNMVSRESFSTEKRTYQPQLGSWNGRTLSYNREDSQTQNYIVDSKQGLSVNSWFLPESYNNIFKQLMVSDEIYWVYDEPNNFVKPLTITTSNIVFKTGVVDHLIQYQFDFEIGQGYKLII
jgi:hypothetical protein